MIDQLFLRSTAEGPPLRVGLMLDSAVLPAWLAGVLDNLIQADFVDVCYLIWNASPSPPPVGRRSAAGKVARVLSDSRLRRRLLFDLYERFDNRAFPFPDGASPFAPRDCSDTLERIPFLRAAPIAKGFTHRFRPEDLAAIREQRLDVILRWGFHIIRGEILETARYGVWSYHHGDSDFYRGGPPAFWEVAEKAPLTGVVLQVLSDELDGGTILARGHVPTASDLSVNRNRFEQYWHGAAFVIEKLWQLHEHGWETVRGAALANDFRGKRKIYRTPTNAAVAKFAVPRLVRKGFRRATRGEPTVGHWRVALRRRPTPLDPSAPGVEEFHWLEAPKGRFWADPMLIAHGGRCWAFFEDFDYGSGRGEIACAEVDPHGKLGDVETALAPGFHLSYPHLFEDGGEVWMIPESGDHGTVDLYVAEQFPNRWKKVKTLLEGQAAYDVTLWVDEGRYWFFATLAGRHGARYQLLLFSADSLTGDWRLHPSNPISLDIRIARGAGPLFRDAGRLIRPAQDCSRAYGGGLIFEEITELTPSHYASRRIGDVTPGSFPGRSNMIGIHTYSRCGDLEAIDGCWTEPSRLHKPA